MIWKCVKLYRWGKWGRNTDKYAFKQIDCVAQLYVLWRIFVTALQASSIVI